MSDFSHVVITGVSRGIGGALFRYFAERGVSVSGCARSKPEGLPEAGHMRFDPVDVRSRLGVERWAETVVAERGAPDLLINGAAVGMEHGRFHAVDLKAAEDLLNTNFAGTVRVTHAFLSSMVMNGGGVVANLTTPPQGIPSRDIVPYATSKYAIRGFTQALVAEKHKGMAFVDVFPGILDTALTRGSFGDRAGRFPSPEAWIDRAGPFFEGLSVAQNGEHLAIT